MKLINAKNREEKSKKFFMLCVGSEMEFSHSRQCYMSDPLATTVSHNQTSNVKTCLLYLRLYFECSTTAFCALKMS